MSTIKNLLGSLSSGGKADPTTSTLWTTPVAWRDADGAYVGHNGEVWLYRVFPQVPLEWEDPNTRLAVAGPLDAAMHELAATSQDLGSGIAMLARQREFHLISLAWDQPADVPAGTPDLLGEYIDACLDFTVPTRALFLGVKLRSSMKAKVDREATGMKSLMASLADSLTRTLGEDVPDMADYEDDRQRVERILAKYHAKTPARDQRKQLESWFNHGRGPDVEVYRTRDALIVDREDRIEFGAVLAIENEVLESPMAQWALDAFTHPEGSSVISIRGQLQPNKVARARVRKSIRKLRAQQEEEAATTDIDKPEFAQQQQQAQQVEDWILNSGEPLVTDCSIVFGRRVHGGDVTETFIDDLRDRYGIVVKTLDWRQLDALDECLPCSDKRVGHPFSQDVSVSLLSYAGLQGFSNLGDPVGVYTGLADPDWTPTYLNPIGAPLANLPAAMAVLGDSGSGKTYFLQTITAQAALAGQKVVFINPKPFDDLSPTVEMLKEQGVPGSVVHLSRLEQMGGFFDPFRFVAVNPDLERAEALRLAQEQAAEIATTHILGVLTGLTEKQELSLSFGLKRGALRGARCVKDALGSVDDPEVVELVLRQAQSNSLFALGIGFAPQERLDAQQGFTLIQFDRKLDLPEEASSDQGNYTRSQRVALAALRLITTASLEMLIGGGGGVLVVDEAHHYLGSSQGRKQLQSLGREGRSQGLLPILATQRISDLVGHDLESYVSRWWCGKLTERREAEAALRLCGLEPTEARLKWLSDCGPKPAEDGMPFRPSMFLHRDLKGRHAAVMVGPTPPAAHEAFSTNPADRAKRKAEAAAAAAASGALGEGVDTETAAPTLTSEGVDLVALFDSGTAAASAPSFPEPPAPAPEPPPAAANGGWLTLTDDDPSIGDLTDGFGTSST